MCVEGPRIVQKIRGKSSDDSLLLKDFFGPQWLDSHGMIQPHPNRTLQGVGHMKQLPRVPKYTHALSLRNYSCGQDWGRGLEGCDPSHHLQESRGPPGLGTPVRKERGCF